MAKLEGRYAIVTGAGRGLGQAIAIELVRQGASVAVVSLTPAKIDETVAAIEAEGGTAIGVPCDVRDAGQIKSAVEKVVGQFGGIDILVNNAFGHENFALRSVLETNSQEIE